MAEPKRLHAEASILPDAQGGYMRDTAVSLAAVLAACLATAAAAQPSLDFARARVEATDRLRADVPLYMTIVNHGSEPDSLLRVKCPVSFFTEKRTTDVGEGGKASREVKSIPVPVGETMLKPNGYYVMLLQTTQPLKQGETFTCSIAFKNAGTREVEVQVVASGEDQ